MCARFWASLALALLPVSCTFTLDGVERPKGLPGNIGDPFEGDQDLPGSVILKRYATGNLEIHAHVGLVRSERVEVETAWNGTETWRPVEARYVCARLRGETSPKGCDLERDEGGARLIFPGLTDRSGDRDPVDSRHQQGAAVFIAIAEDPKGIQRPPGVPATCVRLEWRDSPHILHKHARKLFLLDPLVEGCDRGVRMLYGVADGELDADSIAFRGGSPDTDQLIGGVVEGRAVVADDVSNEKRPLAWSWGEELKGHQGEPFLGILLPFARDDGVGVGVSPFPDFWAESVEIVVTPLQLRKSRGQTWQGHALSSTHAREGAGNANHAEGYADPNAYAGGVRANLAKLLKSPKPPRKVSGLTVPPVAQSVAFSRRFTTRPPRALMSRQSPGFAPL